MPPVLLYRENFNRKRLEILQADGGTERRFEAEAQPVYLAMVDLSCNEDFLELVKTSLLAALEALPNVARFGLVTFSNKVKPPHNPDTVEIRQAKEEVCD
jgi:hypothetical protein